MWSWAAGIGVQHGPGRPAPVDQREISMASRTMGVRMFDAAAAPDKATPTSI